MRLRRFWHPSDPPLKNPDFAALFKTGGLHMNSKEPANTIGSVLTRRMNEVGDVVRVGRGTWGLKEWYPGRSFKAKDDEKKDEKRPQQEGEGTGLTRSKYFTKEAAD